MITMPQINRRLIGEETMRGLSLHIGRDVTVEYAERGALRTVQGRLMEVNAFSNVIIDLHAIPFIGHGTAVRSITYQGHVIYDNSDRIHGHYDAPFDGSREYGYREASFGTQIANQLQRRQESAKLDRLRRPAY